jgi:hypothetical protein
MMPACSIFVQPEGLDREVVEIPVHRSPVGEDVFFLRERREIEHGSPRLPSVVQPHLHSYWRVSEEQL